MKLTLKIKLLPSEEQAELLLNTIKEANTVCNAISKIAWEKRMFNNFKLHHEVYHPFRDIFKLSSQVLIRQIAKVANSYKLSKKEIHKFRSLGSIAYDSRIMTYKPNGIVSLWCIGGRQKIKYVCHNTSYLPYIKGEADLVFKKGKFYLFQTVDIVEEDISDVEEFIGVDFGITEIASTSDGLIYSGEEINNYREKRQKVRSSIQSKCTRNSRKLLKRLSGKERTHSAIINHTISKNIVDSAKKSNRGIAIENLKGISLNSKRRNKKFKKKLNNWSFFQLKNFIEYKSKIKGVPVIVVNPRFTSQTCNECKHIGERKNKSFKCINKKCEVDVIDADFNASKNIAFIGASVDKPERCSMYSCAIHY